MCFYGLHSRSLEFLEHIYNCYFEVHVLCISQVAFLGKLGLFFSVRHTILTIYVLTGFFFCLYIFNVILKSKLGLGMNCFFVWLPSLLLSGYLDVCFLLPRLVMLWINWIMVCFQSWGYFKVPCINPKTFHIHTISRMTCKPAGRGGVWL